MRILMLGVACGVIVATAFFECRPSGRGKEGAREGGSSVVARSGEAPAEGGGVVGKRVPFEGPVLQALEEEYTKLVESVLPSVVSITTETRIKERELVYGDFFDFIYGPRQRVVEHKQEGLGSGVVVSGEGYVLTNEHVVAGMEKIRVQMTDGRIFPAELVGTDILTDIAVLKIQGSGKGAPFASLPFGDSDKVRMGQPVFAVGNPFGFQETVTQGIVSAKERALRDSGVEFLQTDAAVNPGNSGGPLLNVRGEIIGINSSIYSKSGTWLGISFAIPANVAKHSMESILKTGKVERQTLGVVTTALKASMAAQYGLREPVGALVARVKPGSPAEKAGLQRGDVILRVNGKVLSDPAALYRALEGKAVGTKIQLGVVRDGREYQVLTEVAALSEERSAK